MLEEMAQGEGILGGEGALTDSTDNRQLGRVR